MSMISFGDLAKSLVTKQQIAQLRTSSARLTEELSTGRHSDMAAHMAGDHSRLSAIQRSRDLAQSFLSIIDVAAFRTDATQSVLDRMVAASQAVTGDLRLASQDASDRAITLASERSRQSLGSMISALNSAPGGRALFAGIKVAGAAVVDAETILTALRGELPGSTTAEEVVSRILGWFDDPAGFAGSAYLGGAAETDLTISEGITVQTGVTALDPAIRASLAGIAMGALLDDPALSLPGIERQRLATLAADASTSGEGQVLTLAGHLGLSQSGIEAARTDLGSEVAALDIALSAIVSSDPFKVATELEAVQTNLETLYAVTARISRLSLADFIR